MLHLPGHFFPNSLWLHFNFFLPILYHTSFFVAFINRWDLCKWGAISSQNSFSPSGIVRPLILDGPMGSLTGTLLGSSCLHFAIVSKPFETFSGPPSYIIGCRWLRRWFKRTLLLPFWESPRFFSSALKRKFYFDYFCYWELGIAPWRVVAHQKGVLH